MADTVSNEVLLFFLAFVSVLQVMILFVVMYRVKSLYRKLNWWRQKALSLSSMNKK